MFETASDQQSQSSVIVVSNNNVVVGGINSLGHGVASSMNTHNVVDHSVSGVDGAINALNDAIVDAIDQNCHQINGGHINILSSYYYCKNLVEFSPQFQPHHVYSISNFNLPASTSNILSLTSSSNSLIGNNSSQGSSCSSQAASKLIKTSIFDSQASHSFGVSDHLADSSFFSLTDPNEDSIVKNLNNILNESVNSNLDTSSKASNSTTTNTSNISLNTFTSLLQLPQTISNIFSLSPTLETSDQDQASTLNVIFKININPSV
jgi:hypothetical protein